MEPTAARQASQPSGCDPVYRFLHWQAEPRRNRLVDGEREIRVTPRSMEVLVYLLDHGGRVVSKDELLREVWQGQAVTDDALVVTIYELRKALGDRARQPTYLETVPRRGYRFIPEVRVDEAVPAHAPRTRGWKAAVLAALAFSGTAIALNSFQPPRDASEVATNRPSPVLDPRIEALLLEARRGIDLRTARSLDRAAWAYEQLQALTPDDLRVEAGLARLAATRADLRLGDRFALYHEAKSRAEKVLAVEPRLADAHLALGTTQLLLDWDLAGAAESLDQALRWAPDDPDVHQVRTWLLSARGDHRDAEHAARQAISLDPESASRRADLAFVLLVAGRADQGIAEAEAGLLLDPTNGSAFAVLIRSHLALGDEAAAQHLLHQRIGQVAEVGSEAFAGLDYWSLLARVLDALPADQELTTRAGLRAQTGEDARALELLERAFARRDWEILWLEHLPELAPLRQAEAFRRLIHRRETRQLG